VRAGVPSTILFVVTVSSVISASTRAHADDVPYDASFNDPYAVPAAPRPPTLPQLTHTEAEGTLEATAGAILPNAGGAITHAYVQRFALEVPLGPRRWYVGATYELGDANGQAVSGNLELGVRTLWATRTGLAFGGGVDVIVPTARFDQFGQAARTALDAATLRPWDVAFFVPSALGGRPYVDVRAIDGRFVAQFRQALDVLTTTDSLGTPYIYATVGVYFGFWATREVAAGFEAFESYAIDVNNVSDGARAAVVVSPNVRLVLPWVEPAISAFTNIGTPLQGANQRIWGFRLAFTLVYDPNRALGLSTRSAAELNPELAP
jgi:hypothetical protein